VKWCLGDSSLGFNQSWGWKPYFNWCWLPKPRQRPSGYWLPGRISLDMSIFGFGFAFVLKRKVTQ